MCKFYVTSAVVLCLLADLGCQSGTTMQQVEYAALQTQATDSLLLRVSKCPHVNRQQQEADESLPKIAIETHVVIGDLADL